MTRRKLCEKIARLLYDDEERIVIEFNTLLKNGLLTIDDLEIMLNDLLTIDKLKNK